MIAFALGRIDVDSATVLRILLDNAAEQNDPATLLASDCPHYTTSLDAAIPGENIILSLYQPKRQAWTAVHRSDRGDIVGTGASEPLARRVAALKAILATGTGSAAVRPIPTMTPTPSQPSIPTPEPAVTREPDATPSAPEPGRGRSGANESGDWEILW